MTEYPKGIKFKYSWRKYQQRVLDDLQEHLTDKHLHVIAPPGSGKTVLGLEVAIRLNRPTLILAPTIAIRNQWIHRLCELFLQTDQIPDWISRDIRNPKFMTVITYQGLHAACNNLRAAAKNEVNKKGGSRNNKLEAIVRGLKSQNIKTFVMDEAHHLKNEWWHTLTGIKDKINPTIVGLTATPPYDVTETEWQRYIDLNGPVDTEISVPELVIEGDLCPHQDCVYLSLPTENESQKILDFRQNIEKLFQGISCDETLAQAIEGHPFWIDPTQHLEWIYNNLSYYSACLIFLNSIGKEVPKIHLEIIGDKELIIPQFDYDWAESLLDFYLFKEKEHFMEFEEHQTNLENRLRRHGAMDRRQINFSYNRGITKSLTSSISKLNGIKDIVDFEYKALGKDLRLVILSDFIRKEFFIHASDNKLELNKIGIIPIFEKLRRENHDNKKIGVLTGSIIIIPASAYPVFKEKTEKLGITQINTSPVPFDSNYILIHQTEQLRHDVVHVITQVFEAGEIEVLIGTKSLLGEGWDAPAINSLIMASFVGSFVLSNQMRGRAIRTQNGNPNKTGNIWHLGCIDPTLQTGGDDLELLKRRFRSFVGISFREDAGIENGIGRLNLPKNIYSKEEVERVNTKMFSFARDRESLKERWTKALATGVNLVEEIKVPFPEEKEYDTVKSFYLKETIKNLLLTLASTWIGFGLDSIDILDRLSKDIKTKQQLYFVLIVLGIVGFLSFGRQTYKALRIYLNYRDISKDIQQIGNALLNALLEARSIKPDQSELKVEAYMDASGAVYCHLLGGTTYDKSTFINALKEVIAPINNPRYVIIRKNNFMLFIKQKDYHSVPDILGRNKKLAEYFKNQWEQLVGSCDLIFTRTIKGRKLLLRSKMKSLSTQFDNKPEHVNKWR